MPIEVERVSSLSSPWSKVVDSRSQSYASLLVSFIMDAKEHLYKVLVIGEYGVGKLFYVL